MLRLCGLTVEPVMMATFLSDGAAEPMIVSYRGVVLSAGIELVSGDVRDRVCVERAMSVLMTEELHELPAFHEGPALFQGGVLRHSAPHPGLIRVRGVIIE